MNTQGKLITQKFLLSSDFNLVFPDPGIVSDMIKVTALVLIKVVSSK